MKPLLLVDIGVFVVRRQRACVGGRQWVVIATRTATGLARLAARVVAGLFALDVAKMLSVLQMLIVFVMHMPAALTLGAAATLLAFALFSSTLDLRGVIPTFRFVLLVFFVFARTLHGVVTGWTPSSVMAPLLAVLLLVVLSGMTLHRSGILTKRC